MLRPDTYKDYLRVINAYLTKGEKLQLSKQTLSKAETGELCITAKNYSKPSGVSTKLSTQKIGASFKVKGPMGKGMALKASGGVNIAFTGGTGVLPFLDLVAYLVRVNLGLCPSLPASSPLNNPTFKIVLFVSYASA